MGSFEPKQGRTIQVKQRVGDVWRGRVFVATHKGGFLCEVVGSNEGVYRWELARPLPTKPEPTPFTHETWPKQVVWIRMKGSGVERLVKSRDKDKNMVSFGVSWTSYMTLFTEHEMSLDFCQTWQPCHYVPESEE